MNDFKEVIYNGIRCKLFKEYMKEGDGPLVMVMKPEDLDKAYAMGFECIGFPNEVVKYLTDEEYEEISETN